MNKERTREWLLETFNAYLLEYSETVNSSNALRQAFLAGMAVGIMGKNDIDEDGVNELFIKGLDK
jgi:hypothetical protein